MEIKSEAFKDREMIPKKYTCKGENVSPPLSFTNVPEQTESLALVVDDPDAPGGTWTHWTVYGLSPEETGLPEGKLPPSAREGITSFGKPGYGGPCPPSGIHRYFFKLYALSTMLDLPMQTTHEELMDLIGKHTIESAELVGLFGEE